MEEFIYVLENPSMPGILKIGRTERSVERRVSELSSHTGVPTDFNPVKVYSVNDSVGAERKVHDHLSAYRISENREFFQLSLDEATAAIEDVLSAGLRTTERNFEREDQLLMEATVIVRNSGRAFPGLLVALLKIGYDEAVELLEGLKARGILPATIGYGTPSSEQDTWLQNEALRRKAETALAQATEEAYEYKVDWVKSVLDKLNEGKTGEQVTAQFRREGSDLMVTLDGPDNLTARAREIFERESLASAALSTALADAKALLAATHPLLSPATQSLPVEDDEEAVDEELIEQCIEVIRSEQKASVSLLQRRLKIGYGRAARIMDVLEERGFVGPSKGAEPRDILIDLDGEGHDGAGQQMV